MFIFCVKGVSAMISFSSSILSFAHHLAEWQFLADIFDSSQSSNGPVECEKLQKPIDFHVVIQRVNWRREIEHYWDLYVEFNLYFYVKIWFLIRELDNITGTLFSLWQSLFLVLLTFYYAKICAVLKLFLLQNFR